MKPSLGASVLPQSITSGNVVIKRINSGFCIWHMKKTEKKMTRLVQVAKWISVKSAAASTALSLFLVFLICYDY